MSLYLHAIGTALPPESIGQVDAARLAESFCEATTNRQQMLQKLYRHSGVRERHSVILEPGDAAIPEHSFYPPAKSDTDVGPTTGDRMEQYEQHAAPLAIAASRAAFASSRMTPGDVTHLVTISCTGFHAPGFEIALIRVLGLPVGVARTHVGFMGCHAALNGLRVAKAFTDANPQARVLICAAELCSLHYQYGWQPDQIVANSLFADGAAAVLAEARPANSETWELTSSASVVVPETEDAMSWRIRDHGFEMTLSSRVPDLIQAHLRPWLETWLDGCGLKVDQIAAWAIHPGGPRILTACREACEFDAARVQASFDVLAECGNMSSPTVLFILQRLQRLPATRPCVALGFGPGLTIEAALFR